jgi:hypothetical protein
MNSAPILRTGLTWAIQLAALFAVAVALPVVTFEAEVQAQRFGETKTIQGRIQSFTTAPMGEVDGAVLDDGTVVHWPPHLADRFTPVALTGDRIRVAGRTETGPAGDTHFEAEKVTNLRTNASAENELGPHPPAPAGRVGPPRPGPLAPRGVLSARTGQTLTAQGRVKLFTTAPMGEVDGAVLDDATVIHWPPHLADRFTAIVARGDRIRVSGWTEKGPAGDTHLEVQTAVNLSTNASASADGGPAAGRIAADGSGDFAPPRASSGDVERRLKELEDQVAQMREEIRRLRDEL